jgi:hypothetical protein
MAGTISTLSETIHNHNNCPFNQSHSPTIFTETYYSGSINQLDNTFVTRIDQLTDMMPYDTRCMQAVPSIDITSFPLLWATLAAAHLDAVIPQGQMILPLAFNQQIFEQQRAREALKALNGAFRS